MYLVNAGLIDYKKSLDLQHKIVNLKEKSFPDVLLLLEHPPVITIGHRGNESNILVSGSELEKRRIPIFYVERGGDVTYHGPGQLVGYPIVRLKNFELKVKEFIENLEEVIILTLSDYSITGTRNPVNNGVWIGNSKIASTGIRLKKWISFHGFSLNVCTSLEEFGLIKPCGLEGVGVVSMEALKGRKFDLTHVSKNLTEHFSKVFNCNLEEISLEELLERMKEFE